MITDCSAVAWTIATPAECYNPAMPKIPALIAAIILLASPLTGSVRDAYADLNDVAKALGAATVKSIQYTGTGGVNAAGQSVVPGLPWPEYNVKSHTRSVNYETASLRDEQVRTQALEPARYGGLQPIRGEQRLNLLVSGDIAWNLVGEQPASAPIALADRQFQLWATPHGIVKAAMARNATMQGRTITFNVPGRFNLKATVSDDNLIARVEGLLPNPVVGDIPVMIDYWDYRDFGGVKFPTRIRETTAGYPTLDLLVTDVRPNAAVDIQVPDVVRQDPNPYARVTAQKAADGVWYLTGGTHHSVVIEMKDHIIVVEAPLNEERSAAVIAETRKLVPNKPIRYVINSHHHFDHAGGLRAFVAEGATVITQDVNRAFLAQALGAPSTVRPDAQAKSGRQPTVEGVGERRTLTDGTRTVEIYRIQGIMHHDGLLMVYLPKEKLLSQADAYTPGPPSAAPPMPPSPFNFALADNIARLKLDVGDLLPLHGRLVPVAELYRAIGKTP
jgi:glyoxylase-like metal-dependent hydrolase (beta-lactamase superfamily II)